MAGLVLREDHEGVTKLTLNLPEKLNALSMPLFIELRKHLDEIVRQTETVGLIVLRGAGRGFSARNDLAATAAGQQ